MKVILASQSPRRRELMGMFRIPFAVQAAEIDESMNPGRPACEEVSRVARQKAMAIPGDDSTLIVAADTIVVLDGKVMGKPKNEAQARQMLCSLSGRQHEVMTGLALRLGDRVISCTEVTEVQFRSLSFREIDAYIATGEPMDKAGAYGIQGGAALFVEGIRGDYYNVMGLPVCRLGRLLAQLAPDLLEDVQ